jgi:tetratricopeptide (TPR) repeat protein
MVAALGLVLVSGEAEAQTGAARGKVLDENGQPVADAKIEIDFKGGVTRKYETKTNKKGEFIQVGLQPGNYDFTASKEGYAPDKIGFRISLGDPTYLPEFKLKTAKAAAEEAAKASGAGQLKAAFDGAVKLAQEGKLDEAEAAYKEILTKAPSVAEVHYNLGYIYSQKKDWANAEAAYQKALEIRPDYSEATLALARVYQDSGQGDKALALMNKASEGPGNGKVLFSLAITHFNAGRYAEATEALLKAEAADPQNAEIQYYLGTCYLNQNKIPDSLARLEKYLSMNPQNAQNVATAQGLLQALKPKK